MADGGVLTLLNGRVTTRVSRYTYGVRCSERFRAWDPAHRLRMDTIYFDSLTGFTYVPGYFETVLPVVCPARLFACLLNIVTEHADIARARVSTVPL